MIRRQCERDRRETGEKSMKTALWIIPIVLFIALADWLAHR